MSSKPPKTSRSTVFHISLGEKIPALAAPYRCMSSLAFYSLLFSLGVEALDMRGVTVAGLTSGEFEVEESSSSVDSKYEPRWAIILESWRE